MPWLVKRDQLWVVVNTVADIFAECRLERKNSIARPACNHTPFQCTSCKFFRAQRATFFLQEFVRSILYVHNSYQSYGDYG
jgi:hypothetical protein